VISPSTREGAYAEIAFDTSGCATIIREYEGRATIDVWAVLVKDISRERNKKE